MILLFNKKYLKLNKCLRILYMLKMIKHLGWHSNRHLKIISWLQLLDSNIHSLDADIHTKNDEIFRWACENNYQKLAILLQSLGADIHAKNDEAFRLACLYKHIPMAKWLHSLGTNIHANNDEVFRLMCRRKT